MITSYYHTVPEAAKRVEPALFQASYPDSLNPDKTGLLQRIWDVISIVIFPIGFVRFCLRNYLFSAIVPGARDCSQEDIQPYKDDLLKFGEEVRFKTPDGAEISGYFYEGDEHPEKVVFYATGNAGQWELESDAEAVQEAIQKGYSVFMINPRGVGDSKGYRSADSYALDFYSGFEYLMKVKQFKLKDIAFWGFSMGGALGTLGAALIQEKYKQSPAVMIADRTFKDLATEAYYITTERGRNSCFIYKAFLFIEACILYFLVKLFGMNIDVLQAWNKLGCTKACYWIPEDKIIPFNASLAAGLRKAHQLIVTDSSSSHLQRLHLQDRVCMAELIDDEFGIERESPQ